MSGTTLRLTGPEEAALVTALEYYLEHDPSDTDAQSVLDRLENAS